MFFERFAMFTSFVPDAISLMEVAGVAGFGVYVSNYLMLTFRVLTGDCIIYYTLNVAAASLVLTGLMNSFDLASALIQIFWICISTVGIFMRLRRKYHGTI